MNASTQPVNAGPLVRLFTILASKAQDRPFLRRLMRSFPCLTNIYIKVKPLENLAEAHAMQIVAQQSSVPVPKVHCAFIHKGHTYIAMSRIKGHDAARGWNSRSDASKARVLGQLRQIITELHSIPAPAGIGISNVNGGPFYDCRLTSEDFWGPYATTREFYEALANGANLDVKYAALPNKVSELFSFYRQAKYDLVLTHGDLSSLNILVQGDEVVGIVDWETAGWFPSYWEYICAKNVNPIRNPSWADEVDRFLTPMPNELRMENIRREYFGYF